MTEQKMTPIQKTYARLVKKAETELCQNCGEELITDIWHSLCSKCAINAEATAYATEMDRLHEPPEEYEEDE